MSDVQRAMDEAKHAREAAAAAHLRAEEMEKQAEAAQQRSRQEHEERQRAWAQRTVDTYDADLSTADAAVQAAQAAFEKAVATDLATALTAYLAWGEAASRHYALQVRVDVAAPLVGFDASAPEPIALPLFSQAVDNALQKRLADLSDRARDEMASELRRLSSDGAGDRVA